MSSLKRHICFGIWFLLLAFSLIQCENESFSAKGEIDYYGQFGTIADINGNVYQSFGIGTQIWMAQNLRTSRLNNGVKINLVIDNNLWKSLN